MIRYLLNSAGGDGDCTYRTLNRATPDWMSVGDFTELSPGDQALVVRLAYRETDPGAKASQTIVRTISCSDYS